MSMAAQAPSRRDASTSSIKPRVLIVEDETALVELLRYNLEQSGFRVSVAYDGEEALASVQEDVPDLILLDWMLPRMSGTYSWTTASASSPSPATTTRKPDCSRL